jgi:DnaK suppressor protein
MIDHNSLMKLTSRLLAQRDALRKTLNDDLDILTEESAASQVGDDVDAALHSANDEVCSQLIEIESQQLDQIEHALERIKAKAYGHCEFCGGQISAARLSALPHTDSCIDCQRKKERRGHSRAPDSNSRKWSRIHDDSTEEETDNAVPIDFGDLEKILGGSGYRVLESLIA